VVQQHSQYERVLRVSVPRKRGEQNLLLAAEVMLAVVAPIGKEAILRVGRGLVRRTSESLSDSQTLMVVSGKWLQGTCSLHEAVPVVTPATSMRQPASMGLLYDLGRGGSIASAGSAGESAVTRALSMLESLTFDR
jgi:hypothetical protein